MPDFASKRPAPRVYETLRPAIDRSRRLEKAEETKATDREIDEDVLRKLELPAALAAHLRKKHGISP